MRFRLIAKAACSPTLARRIAAAALFSLMAGAAGCSDDDFGTTKPTQDMAAPGQSDLATAKDLSVAVDSGASDGGASDGGGTD